MHIAHVAGILFRVEAAVLIGVTYPTCTSILASWNVPSKKKQIIPGRLKDFLFKSESCSKKSLERDTVDRLKKKAETRIFFTVSNSEFTHLNDKKKLRNQLLEAIADIARKYCFVELMTGQKVKAKKSQINVPTLVEFAESFIDTYDPELDICSFTEMFADSILLTALQINSIYQQTIDQSKVNGYSLTKVYIARSYCTELRDSGDDSYKKYARSRIRLIKMAFNGVQK